MQENQSNCQRFLKRGFRYTAPEKCPLISSKGGMLMQSIGGVGDLKTGEMKEIIYEGHKILLVRSEEGFHAVGNRCPHLGCKLSQGTLQGAMVTCPCHHSRFDIRTGQVMEWIPKWPGIMGSVTKKFRFLKPLPVYSLEIKDGHIYLDLHAIEKEE